MNNYDPKHYRFERTLNQTGHAIEDCGGTSRAADKLVFVCAAVIAIVLLVVTA